MYWVSSEVGGASEVGVVSEVGGASEVGVVSEMGGASEVGHYCMCSFLATVCSNQSQDIFILLKERKDLPSLCCLATTA